MTNAEIIKSIELCNGWQFCDKCAFANVKPKKNRTCCEQLMLEAGKLIRQPVRQLPPLQSNPCNQRTATFIGRRGITSPDGNTKSKRKIDYGPDC